MKPTTHIGPPTGLKPILVRFRDAFNIGPKSITGPIENSPRLNESFELDFERQVVWVSIDVGNGKKVWGFSPMSNVLGCKYEDEKVEAVKPAPAPNAA